MRTAKEREEAFRYDLAALLAKHKADLEITDDGEEWGMQSGVAVVTMAGERDVNGCTVEEYTEFRI